jgi:hypothetical protein
MACDQLCKKIIISCLEYCMLERLDHPSIVYTQHSSSRHLEAAAGCRMHITQAACFNISTSLTGCKL